MYGLDVAVVVPSEILVADNVASFLTDAVKVILGCEIPLIM